MRSTPPLLLLVVVALGGCAADDTPGTVVPFPVLPAPPATTEAAPAPPERAPERTPPACDPLPTDTSSPRVAPACEAWPIAPTWATLEPSGPLYGSVQMRVSNNGGLVFSSGEFGGVLHRTADGQLLGSVHQVSAGAMDAAWTLTAQADQPHEQVLVREVDSGITVATLSVPPTPNPESDWLRDLQTTLTPDGATAVAIMCWDQPGEGPEYTVVGAWDVATGELTVNEILSAACGQSYWASRPPLLTTADGSGALLPFPGAPVLAWVDLQTGESTLLDLDAEAADIINAPSAPFGLSPVLSVVMSPSGHEVAVVDQSSVLRRFRLPTLEPVGTPVAAGLALVNQHTYVPSVESPLAWSPSGELLAFVGPDGEPTLLDAATGEIVTTLERPTLDEQTPWSGPTEGYLLGLAFGADGLTVLANGEAGAAAWRCVDAAVPALDGGATVTIEVPATLTLGEPVTIGVQAEGVDETAVFTLVFDDEPLPSLASLGAAIELTTWQEGTHTLAVIVDDGLTSAISEPVTVTIQPAP